MPEPGPTIQTVWDARKRYESLLEQLGTLLGPDDQHLAEDLTDAAHAYFGGERRLVVAELMRCLPGVAGAVELVADDVNQRLHED